MIKQIKYLALLLSAVFFFGGCNDDELLGEQNAGKVRPTVTVTPGTVSDTESSFTLAASEDAVQYGFVVLAGEGLTPPDAYAILTNMVAGTLKRGVYHFADQASMMVSFACEPDADYTVFAAAITSTGLVSEVKVWEFHVADQTAPKPISFQALSGSSVAVYFSEEHLSFSPSETLQATVSYYQPGKSRVEGKIVITDPQPIPRENISINGNQVTFTVDEHPGATFLVDIPSGLFVDAAGNGCVGVRNHYDETKEDFTAAHGDTPSMPFALLPDYFEKNVAGKDWGAEGASVRITLPFVVYEDVRKGEAVRMAYYEKDGLKYLNTTYTLTVADGKSVVEVRLPKKPEGPFDVDIPEGVFFDEWGNVSVAFRLEPEEYRYEQIIAIRTGRYLVSYPSLTGYPVGVPVLSETSGKEFQLGLQPYDAEKGLYMIGTTWFNMTGHEFVHQNENTVINPVLVGKVDFATHSIVFDGSYLDPRDGYKSIVKNKEGENECAFDAAFYVDNLEKPAQGLFFQGGGEDGKAPLVLTFDDEGKVVSISKCGFALRNFDEENTLAAYYDAIWETGTMTYSPN